MTAPQTHTAPEEATNGPIPPLVHGEHLTRAEFERRYDAMPRLKKAELIEGVVYMPSPVRLEEHGGPHADLITWLGLYRVFTPGVAVGAESSVRLGAASEPQPDALMFIRPSHGGCIRISADDYVEGGPELVAEVSASSIPIDTGPKLQLYERYGVQEYIVWRVPNREIDWFVRRGGGFTPLAADAAGVLRSEVFPGLWLDAAALVGGDMGRVYAVLQQGLASPEHADFVARLAQAARTT